MREQNRAKLEEYLSDAGVMDLKRAKNKSLTMRKRDEAQGIAVLAAILVLMALAFYDFGLDSGAGQMSGTLIEVESIGVLYSRPSAVISQWSGRGNQTNEVKVALSNEAAQALIDSQALGKELIIDYRMERVVFRGEYAHRLVATNVRAR